MILATRSGDREMRFFSHQNTVPTWSAFSGALSASGVPVTQASAMGLPTIGAAIRLISETIAGLPLHVYSGEDADKRKARTSPQWRLLHEEPNPDQSAFDFLSDVSASVEGYGNAFVRKLKVRGEILALYLLPPWGVMVKRDEGNRKVFEVGLGGERETLTDAQVIHVRGFTPDGSDVGISPIQAHREAIGAALALQGFQGSFYRNGATPDLYMSVPGALNQDQVDQIRARWRQTHGGVQNAGEIAILGNGAELRPIGIPLRDAQYVESQEHAADLVAKIFLGPAAALLTGTGSSTEQDSLRFVNFALLPRLRRIERAFKSDPDLFGDSGLYPEFHVDEFLRADAATRAEVQHKQIQSGLLLIDEGRAELGRPPLPDGVGQIPQVTPVGGAPNPALAPVSPPEEE